MTDGSRGDRVAGAALAVGGFFGTAVLAGLSLVAGLFLLIPLVFVGVLLRTAARHYFGDSDIPPEERI